MNKDDERARQEARRSLAELVGKGIPPSYQSWSYQRTVAFKEAYAKASSALRVAPTLKRLAEALAAIRPFYE